MALLLTSSKLYRRLKKPLANEPWGALHLDEIRHGRAPFFAPNTKYMIENVTHIDVTKKDNHG